MAYLTQGDDSTDPSTVEIEAQTEILEDIRDEQLEQGTVQDQELSALNSIKSNTATTANNTATTNTNLTAISTEQTAQGVVQDNQYAEQLAQGVTHDLASDEILVTRQLIQELLNVGREILEQIKDLRGGEF